MNRIKEKWKYMTLQKKLTVIFLTIAMTILAVNLYIYSIINKMTGKVEEVYISNVSLNELSNALDWVQDSMEEYLNTKSSEVMEEYYRSEQTYRNLIEKLNRKIVDNEILMTEKNIYYLSVSYLNFAEEIIQAKRGRNVEKYNRLYEEATSLYEKIHTFIYSLNNRKFKDNSENYQILMKSLHCMEVISILILILVMLGNLSLIAISTNSVTKPLKQLARAADEVANGNFQIEKISIQYMDEVGIVTGAFNQMVENIRDYIEQLRLTMEKELMMQNHLKDAQLKYLQAQINPHFLFNTLNAGAQLAMMEDANRTGEFLENVAEFFRYNVRKNDQDATLEEELHLVDNYIYILNVRFAGEILFEKEIDETLLQIKVPSMILQPIVENAINYGIRGIEWEGRIELSVYQKENNICISIWDNGIGIEAKRIEQIFSGEIRDVDLKSNSNGVGLRNVIERLGLYFQNQAKLEIISEGKNMGTEVLITLPKEEEA